MDVLTPWRPMRELETLHPRVATFARHLQGLTREDGTRRLEPWVGGTLGNKVYGS